MPSRLSNWMIGSGIVVAFLGLCLLPGARGGDKNLLGFGASVFSLGILAIAGGIYVKASALGPKGRGSKAAKQSAEPSRPIRGGCDRCRQAVPVIQCKVHQQHLCGECLAEHYDFRTCVYTPSARATGLVKALAARAR